MTISDSEYIWFYVWCLICKKSVFVYFFLFLVIICYRFRWLQMHIIMLIVLLYIIFHDVPTVAFSNIRLNLDCILPCHLADFCVLILIFVKNYDRTGLSLSVEFFHVIVDNDDDAAVRVRGRVVSMWIDRADDVQSLSVRYAVIPVHTVAQKWDCRRDSRRFLRQSHFWASLTFLRQCGQCVVHCRWQLQDCDDRSAKSRWHQLWRNSQYSQVRLSSYSFLFYSVFFNCVLYRLLLVFCASYFI